MITRVCLPSRTWVRAAFSLTVENATLQQVTDRLGESPSAGGVLKPEIAQMQFNSDGPLCTWVLRSNRETSDDPNAHIADLLDRLARCKTELQHLVRDGALAEFIVCVLGDDFSVPLALNSGIVARAADIPSAIRVYFTGERKFLAYSASIVFDETCETA